MEWIERGNLGRPVHSGFFLACVAFLPGAAQDPLWSKGLSINQTRYMKEFLYGQLLRQKGLFFSHAGVSRSVAIVTAFVMKTDHLTFEKAYEILQTLKPEAKMNEGFEWQLKLYQAMGYEVDTSSAIYKQYRLQKVTEKYPELQNLPQELFAVDPTTISQGMKDEVLYKCRKCRRSLFRSSSILAHHEGSGPIAFAHKRAAPSLLLAPSSQAQCTSYFIEPVQWMAAALLGVMDGQLLCPKCSAKLGSFNWYGEQCSCGRWITPAFQIHKNRVDEMKMLPALGSQTRK
ncbi:PREDICTED: dual specificity protein phosphatase 12 isoform X3 [Chinchilla lanigera]|uniref:dual specificity protein phosphatase 12 isoform X3 n=1 Tax=Chinchilla lanigera TaxID=34839 RepID=UPI0006960803|nr:PREDICTED: dual specificity protein phosphatase 12 isoform X3 [Chinchilla lanigera]